MDRTVENYQHRDLAAGRWRTMTLSEQLANIEVSSAERKRKEKGDREKEMKAFERGLELLDLSIQDAPAKKAEHPGVFRELLRLREVMCDYFVG